MIGLTYSGLWLNIFSCPPSHTRFNYICLRSKSHMKKIHVLFLLCVIALSCTTEKKPAGKNDIQPPSPEKVPHELTAHGASRTDNYYWMKLSEEQKSASIKDEQTERVLNYLTAENEYLETKLQHTGKLQAKLYDEMVGRIKQDDESVPYKDNGYWYYTRYEQGKEYPIYCRKKGTTDAKEEIMLNVNKMAEGYAYYHVRGFKVSEDNNLVAYGVDTVSRRRYTLYLKDLRTGKTVDQPVPNTEGYVAWANNNKTFFYTMKDSVTLRSDRVFRHTLGMDPESDAIVYTEKDETFSTGITKTKSKKYLVIYSASTLTNDYQLLDADKPEGKFRPFGARERGVEYSINHFKDRFYIVTNLDAPNFRLMETPDTRTGRVNWKEKIPNRRDTLLEGIEIFSDYMVLSERAQANTLMRIIDQKTGNKHYLNFGESAYTVSPSMNIDFDTEWLRYGYSSLATPTSTYDYNMRTKEKKLLKEQEVVGGYDNENYHTERLWATARDGVRVPMSIVYKKGIRKDGSNPTLLYAYGSYGYSTDPTSPLHG